MYIFTNIAVFDNNKNKRVYGHFFICFEWMKQQISLKKIQDNSKLDAESQEYDEPGILLSSLGN
jgi:hypothetical protein